MYWITGQLIGHSNNWLQTEFTTQETRKIINVIVDLLYWFSLSCFFSKWRRVNNTAFHAHPNTKLKYHNDNGNQQRGNGKYRRVEKFSLSLIHSIFTRHNLKCTCRVSIYQFSRGFFSLSLHSRSRCILVFPFFVLLYWLLLLFFIFFVVISIRRRKKRFKFRLNSESCRKYIFHNPVVWSYTASNQ